MSHFADTGFADRRTSAADAKKAQLEKFRASMTQDDPAAAERRAERQRIVEARKIREAEKEAARVAKAAQEAAEKAAAEEARLIEMAAEEERRKEEEAKAAAARPNDSIRMAAMYAAARAAGRRR